MNKHTRSVSLIDGHIEGMTGAEVITALERCGYHNECCYCNSVEECGSKRVLVANALDLIKQQQEQIKKLENIEHFATKTIEKQTAEIERLQKTQQLIKSEAIKEFAEKFKKKAGSIVTSCQGYEIYETKQYQISAVNFDNLVKEMTEVSENGK